METTGTYPIPGSCGSPPSLALPGAVENLAFTAQSNAVPNSKDEPTPCDTSTLGIPSDDQVTNDPNLPFQKGYCPIATFLSFAVDSGASNLKIDPRYVTPITDTLLQTYGNGAYWQNLRCNFHPSSKESPTGTPTCEVVARASRLVAYPDEVELVWFDREDNGDLTDFSSDAIFADATLQDTEGFAVFVALNQTITGSAPDISPLCALKPYGDAAPVYRRYAHDEIPSPGSGGCPLGGCGAPLVRRAP